MLYTSTRNTDGSWTARHSLDADRTEDGGLFVPMRLPTLTHEELLPVLQLPAADAAAKILNLLFAASVTGRDLEFLLGKDFFRICTLNHRLTIGELWQNPDGDYEKTVQAVVAHLRGQQSSEKPALWARTAIDIAMLFAMFTQLPYQTEASLARKQDLVVLSEDFTTPMAAWYARKMGLPVGMIVCCCNENGGVWDLVRRGQMKTDPTEIKTNTPACDIAVPAGIEWLLYETLGTQETLRFAAACHNGGTYELDPLSHAAIQKGLYVTVVGQKRLLDIIPNVYSATGYVLSPYSALGYLGLMDYRAMSGESAPALMVCRHNPMHSAPVVAQAMGIEEGELAQRIKQM